MIEGETDLNGRLMQKFWDVAHVLHHTAEGRASQKRILTLLLRNDGITQAGLTEYLRVQSATASETLTKMEQAGLICRTASEEDRRTICLSLTPMGQQQAAEAAEERARRRQEMFSPLTQEEKEALLPLLEKLTEDWHARYGEPGKRGRRSE